MLGVASGQVHMFEDAAGAGSVANRLPTDHIPEAEFRGAAQESLGR